MGPSFEEIVAHVAPEGWTVTCFVDDLREHYVEEGRSVEAPLSLEQLLEFAHEIGAPTGEEGEPFESVEDFVENAHSWGIEQWLIRNAPASSVHRAVAAAIQRSTSWWIPVLQGFDADRARQVQQLVDHAARCARDVSVSRTPLSEALATGAGLPPSRPPPPYVGHFCGGVTELLRALTAPTDYAVLAQCLDYACVAPDGSVRRSEIAFEVQAALVQAE
jgi:hypothetical protein